MSSVFSKIICGDIPCYKIAEDEKHFAFLDINPLAMGHTLVIPKKEVDYIFDLDDEDTIALQLFAKKVAKAIKKACPCVKVGSFTLGLDVPHAHIHLIPLQSDTIVSFGSEGHLSPTKDEMKEVARRIAEQIG